jgi:hypothetical protein
MALASEEKVVDCVGVGGERKSQHRGKDSETEEGSIHEEVLLEYARKA